MKTTGYFLFFFSVTGTILVAHNINDEKQRFLNRIVELHNHYRTINRKGSLDLDINSTKAEEILTKLQDGVKLHPSKEDGVNYNYENLSIKSVLNDEQALELVSRWYNMANDDNSEKPSSVTADTFTNILCEGPKKMDLALKTKDGVVGVVVTYSPPCEEEVYNTTDNEDTQ